ncbi:hypothetical protein [Deinococcus misasensis]|uniref:hypothetical protein n=1 Tax=Deinococcus misasensis TaxID=392413 RepID=UPI000556FD05|nr:hypothetical protein [Deinococcus misasensis]
MPDHSERDLLFELFPETARKLYPEDGPSNPTLGLYAVDEGKLALVYGDRLLELEPLEKHTKHSVMCDLCNTTLSRFDAMFYRARIGAGLYQYVSLCEHTSACVKRTTREKLQHLVERLGLLD